jgi:hypothetical protein
VAFEGYLKEAEGITSAAGSSGISDDEFEKLKEADRYLTDMWEHRQDQTVAWSGFEDRRLAVKGTVLTKPLGS